jgi:hypothetical protein
METGMETNDKPVIDTSNSIIDNIHPKDDAHKCISMMFKYSEKINIV